MGTDKDYRWVTEGVNTKCPKEKINEIKSSMEYYILMYVDSFISGKAADLSAEEIEYNKLLEVRLFGKESEYLARRESIGEEFSYRTASEKHLEQDEYYDVVQVLDINRERVGTADNGNLNLITVTGGTYSLPVDRQHTGVKIINYVVYDEEGMASVADSRLVEFV